MLKYLLTLVLLSATASAGTIVAASCSSADVNAAITSAVSGDIVQVPGGSCAWSGVSIPSTKGITVDGLGTTTISGGITLNSNLSTGTRITGFTFTSNSAITVNGSTSSAPYRIDHNTLSGGGIMVNFTGNGTGLVDHNSVTGTTANAEMMHNLATNVTNGSAGWADDITPGSPNTMLYLEDNTFTNAAGSWSGSSAIQTYYGGRTVFRHNTCSYCQIDYHGTPGFKGARWFEVYNNLFTTPTGGNQSAYIVTRGGSGVIFNNTHTGPNQQTGRIQMYEEDVNTWPQSYQVGSGINGYTDAHNSCAGGTLNSSPAYVWNNGADMSIQFSGSVVLNRDVFTSASQPGSLQRGELSTDTCSTTYSYTPFAYPYPLTCGGLPDPSGVGCGAVAIVSLSSNNVSCGNSQIGVQVACPDVTLTNSGTATLNISGITIGGINAGDFSQGNTCASTLGAGLSCTITPSFTPTVGGSRVAAISIADDATGSPQSANLSGNGGIPVASLSPASLVFGSLNVSGSSAPQSLTLSNTGTAALSITSISFTGSNTGDFFQSNNCPVGSSLGTSSSCTITVTFTPLAVGARSASLSVADGAAGSPHTSTLSGTGVQPIISGQMNPGARMSGRAVLK